MKEAGYVLGWLLCICLSFLTMKGCTGYFDERKEEKEGCWTPSIQAINNIDPKIVVGFDIVGVGEDGAPIACVEKHFGGTILTARCWRMEWMTPKERCEPGKP